MRISDWSSDVCSSDLALPQAVIERTAVHGHRHHRNAEQLVEPCEPGLERRPCAVRHPCSFREDHQRTPVGNPFACARSEEHTSELQSLMRNSYAGFCLKKKQNIRTTATNTQKERTNQLEKK